MFPSQICIFIYHSAQGLKFLQWNLRHNQKTQDPDGHAGEGVKWGESPAPPMSLKPDHTGRRWLHPRVRAALPIWDTETTEISSARLNQNWKDQFKPDGPRNHNNCRGGSLFEFKEPSACRVWGTEQSPLLPSGLPVTIRTWTPPWRASQPAASWGWIHSFRGWTYGEFKSWHRNGEIGDGIQGAAGSTAFSGEHKVQYWRD